MQPGTHVVFMRLVFDPIAQFFWRENRSLSYIMHYLWIVPMEIQAKGLVETRSVFLFGLWSPETLLREFIEKRGELGFFGGQ